MKFCDDVVSTILTMFIMFTMLTVSSTCMPILKIQVDVRINNVDSKSRELTC